MIYKIGKNVEFDDFQATLTNPEKNICIDLKPLDANVFKQLLVNSGHLVKYEDFYQYWRSKQVSDASLNRVISVLRKQLKVVAGDAISIKNKAKIGYALIVENEQHTPIDNSNISASKTYVVIKENNITIWLLIALFILTLVIIVTTTKADNVIKSSQSSYVQMIEDFEYKSNISFNADRSMYSYVSLLNNKRWKLTIRDTLTNTPYYLEDAEWDFYAPVWLNSKEIIFQKVNESKCYIKKITFNTDFVPIDESNLFTCNPETIAPTITLLSSNYILIKNAILSATHSALFLLNIDTGQVKQVDFFNYKASNIYLLKGDPDSQTIVTLSTNHYNKQSIINIYDYKSDWSHLYELKVDYLLYNIGWEDNNLVFKNNEGGYSIYSIIDGEITERTNHTVLTNLLEVTSSQGQLLFISGHGERSDIIEYDLSGNFESIVVPNEDSNKLAKYYNDQYVFYVSKQTGIPQVRVSDTLAENSWQLSRFKKYKNIKNIAVAKNSNTLLIEVDGQIEIYEIDSRLLLLNKIGTVEGMYPSVGNGYIYYSRNDKTNFNLYQTDIISLKEHLLVQGGKVSLVKNDQLYFSYQHKLGVFSYKNGEIHQLFNLEDGNFKWLFNGEDLFFQKRYEKSIFKTKLGEQESHIILRNDSILSDVNATSLLTVNLKSGKTAISIIQEY